MKNPSRRFHPHRNHRPLWPDRDRCRRCSPSLASGAFQPAEQQGRLVGDMALRIEKAFGVKMDTLMRMQASFNIAQTRKREKQIRVRRVNFLTTLAG